MNLEDYPSDEETSDEEYMPSDGEKVSEEENSGEEEDFVTEDNQTNLGKRKHKPVKAKNSSRKRKGGIQLEDEKGKEVGKDDEYNKQLVEQVKQEEQLKKEDDEKKKTDSLWADFMKDVGGPKPKSKTMGGLGSISSISKQKPAVSKSTPSSSTNSTTLLPAKKVTVTKVFDFAGETVKVSKEVDANSKEAKSASYTESDPSTRPSEDKPAIPGVKRPGGGLSSVLGKIGKAPKMSVLDKSKLDWNSFKAKEGIEEELQIHNRGKQGYIERKQFLERTDLRQFELEKNMRLKNNHL